MEFTWTYWIRKWHTVLAKGCGMEFGHHVSAMAIVCVCVVFVSKARAPNYVNHNEKNDHHDVHSGHFTPLTFQIF